MLCQFAFNDRVVVPEDKSVGRSLILGDTEFGIDVILHTMIVAVQMVRSNIHQYGYIRTEVIHIIQLERTQFDNIIVMVVFGYLQSQALADIACQTYIQTCTLEDMVDEGSRSRLPVRTGDTDHFGVRVTSGKLNL